MIGVKEFQSTMGQYLREHRRTALETRDTTGVEREKSHMSTSRLKRSWPA